METLIKCRFGTLRSFSAAALSPNLGIHKVFLRFLAFAATKKTAQFALAELIIVSIFVSFV